MTLASGPRKVLLVLHVAVSVGWMGAAAAYVAINVPVVRGGDDSSTRAAFLMMPIVADYVIVPLALASLVTGVVLALGTKWGLFQHYWVTISLVLTCIATAVLLLHRPAIQGAARAASLPAPDISTLAPDLVHSVGGLLLLCVPLVLNVVKPRGLTRHGWRVQQAHRRTPSA